ncbi:MAG TPA: hypothetical protein DEQ34_04290 [Balneolaceae bacterium]|nr:hypothetical protein [Balneolaceae bacterium]
MIKRLLSILTVSALLISCGGTEPMVEKPAPSIFEFYNTITSEGLKADLSVLAHDSLEGRETGKPGLDKAARYLAGRYKVMGLKPVGDNGSYFQEFDLDQTVFESVTYNVYDDNEYLIDGSTHSAEEIANFTTLIGGEQSLKGEAVFVGYGLQNEEVNQFTDDVAGKWLVLLYERGYSDFGALRSYIGEGKAVGAILIMGTDVESFTQQAERMQGEFNEGGGLSLSYLNEGNEEFSSAINRINPELAAKVLGFDTVEELDGMAEELKAAPAEFEAYDLPFVFEHSPKVEQRIVKSKNIVAFMEGSDPELKNEVVVLSSHYDHVGIGAPDSTGDTIYNGADDDGSGTVGVLHAAQAFSAAKAAGAGPKRSVLFLNVSGEEKGLLGSRYYSDHPIFEVENTVANLNVDMIGRRDFEHPDNPDYVYIIGGEIISSGLNDMLKQANEESVNIELSDRYNDLEDPNQFYRRSDHWNFGRLGIPFVFFFNGVHEDYHKASDEIEKIDFGALTKRTQLLFATTAMVANAAERPEVDNQVFIEKTQQQPR